MVHFQAFALRFIVSLGLLVLATGPIRAGDTPLTVTLQRMPDAFCFGPCPQWLALVGNITKDSPRVLRKALEASPKVRVILVSSGGGDVASAEVMGGLIRKRRMDVIVGAGRALDCFAYPGNCTGKSAVTAIPGHSYCASACVQLLAAGLNRAIWPHSQVGVHRYLLAARTMVHQVYEVLTRTLPDGREEEIKTLKDETRTVVPVNEEQFSNASYDGARRYFGKMGVDAGLVDAIQSTAHSNIRVLFPSEMKDWKLLTTDDPFGVLAGSGEVPAKSARITATANVIGARNAFVGRIWLDIAASGQPGEAFWRALLFAEGGAIEPVPFTLVVSETSVDKSSGLRPSPILLGENRQAGGSDKPIAANTADLCRFDFAYLPTFSLRFESQAPTDAALHGTFYTSAIQTGDAARSACTALR